VRKDAQRLDVDALLMALVSVLVYVHVMEYVKLIISRQHMYISVIAKVLNAKKIVVVPKEVSNVISNVNVVVLVFLNYKYNHHPQDHLAFVKKYLKILNVLYKMNLMQ